MSLKQTSQIALAVGVATWLVGLCVMPAVAAPSATQTAADRAQVERSAARLDAARKRSAAIDARVERASAELDRVIAEQEQARDRLTARARLMYRTGDTSFAAVLLGAQTFEQFVSRWELLTRMSRQDAADLAQLEAARIAANRSAKSLLKLQADQARAVDSMRREVVVAEKELASSQAALAAYRARMAAAAKPAAASASSAGAPKKTDSKQKLRGSGAWKTGVASHYSRTFTGRGANGERIGPYSMMVAHKTLPFGTLIEFEYGGKRAVAKVADRGPFTPGRDFDLGPGVVRALDFSGVHEVRYRIIKR